MMLKSKILRLKFHARIHGENFVDYIITKCIENFAKCETRKDQNTKCNCILKDIFVIL